MKLNKLWSILMLIVLLFGTAASFSSCSKEDDIITSGSDTGNDAGSGTGTSTESKQDASEWFVYGGSGIGWDGYSSSTYTMEVMENCATYYKHINADGDVKSKEMYSTKSAMRLVNGKTIEYWTFNVGIWGCKESLNSKYYWYSNRDFHSYFEGALNSEKIICYSADHYQYTYTEIEGKLYVANGNIYTRSKNGLIKDGDYGEYEKTDVFISNFENEKKIANRCKNEVHCSYSYEADYPATYSIKVTTPLPRTYDYNNEIVYGVEYGSGCTSDYVEEGISPENGKVNFYISIVFGNYASDYAKAEVIVNAYKSAIEAGRTLTASEERAYKSAQDTMEKMLNKMKQYFEAKVYVRYGGTKYYIGYI